MRHALIMAGGSGTRLWPLSRSARPKQLLRLFDGASLLELSRRRLSGLFEPERIWVITSAAYLDQVAETLPDIPRENLIGEPVGRDTANAIGLAAHCVARRDPGACMAVFTADHLISPVETFQQAVRAGLESAESHPEALVTFGIAPLSAHTGYGYLHRGEPVGGGAFRVRAFKEKPALPVAEEYIRSGEYLWNSGMFAWRVTAILAELERWLPENCAVLRHIAEQLEHRSGGETWPPTAHVAWDGLRKISIDFGVMEKAEQVLTVPMACQWLDLGSWSAIAATRTADANGNVTVAPRTLLLDARDNILVSEDEHLLAALGVRDLIIVHSPDATLICQRAHEQEIRALVELCRQRWPAGSNRLD